MAPANKKLKKTKKKNIMTVQYKQEIIDKYERGMRVADIARLYKKNTSTICSILKKKDEIRGLNVAKGITKLSKLRPRVLEDVEKLLLMWINEKQQEGDIVPENAICTKAKALYTDLVTKMPNTSTDNGKIFKASRGWLDNFKRRSGVFITPKYRSHRPIDEQSENNSLGNVAPGKWEEVLINEKNTNCEEIQHSDQMKSSSYFSNEFLSGAAKIISCDNNFWKEETDRESLDNKVVATSIVENTKDYFMNSTEDSNMHFCMSLHESLQKVSKRFLNKAKIEILQILDKYENTS